MHDLKTYAKPDAGNKSFQTKTDVKIQRKLNVNTRGDVYEQEADRIAENIMRMQDTDFSKVKAIEENIIQRKCSACEKEEEEEQESEMVIQRKCDECKEEADEEEKKVHRKESGNSEPAISRVVKQVLSSSGQPLDRTALSFMQPRFGQDFSHVRVHNDSLSHQSAKDISALAYTHDQHIVFGAGQYRPDTMSGRKLLAHELTHVLQQQAGRLDPHVQRQAVKDPLDDILPAGVGLLETIDRRGLLIDIFGSQTDDLIKEIQTDPKSVEFTRETGILGFLALVDTREVKGFNPSKAQAALDADEKKPKRDRLYRRTVLEPRSDATRSYWFQVGQVRETKKETDELSVSREASEVVDDPNNPFTISAKGIPSVIVNFAFKRNDLRGGKASSEVAKGRSLILDALKKIIGDLNSFPDAPNQAVRNEDLRTRARLKEVFRGFNGGKPLRIFIASGEEEVLRLRLQTETIYIKKEDIGDENKLEAAIRIPMISFTGSEAGPLSVSAFSAEQGAEAGLHELVHNLLIRRGASANDVWETSVKDKVIDGPPTVKNRCEEVIHLYMISQEEVFVFDNLSKLGSAYQDLGARVKPRYELYIAAVESFIAGKGAALDRIKIKLDVAEKVAKKKVDWAIEFQFPKKLIVAGTDLTPLNEIMTFYPAR